MSLQAVIDVARAYLGYTEDPPGSNRTIFGSEYGLDGQPWCVMFLWYCFTHAGERMAFFGGGKTASCSILLRWYKEQGLTVPVEEVQAGDIVILNFHGTKDTEHCGLVVEVKTSLLLSEPPTPTIDAIITIEGNTTGRKNGVQDNGGAVCEKARYPHQIVAVCRPQYQPEPEIVDDITGHWAEADIRWCMEHGLMQGYPDGSFQPDRPVTRAELATVIRRLAEEKEDDLK